MKLINPEVRIENTNYCNAKCIICPREKMTRPKTVMPYSHFVDLVFQAEELGANTISIFGYGEPLIDYDIVPKVQVCTRRGLETFITTNGSLLDLQKGRDLLSAGLSHIRFSVHGIFSRDFERVHRGLSFIDVLRNILNFISINNKRFDGRCKISVSVIPMADESVDAIRRFWEPLVDWLEIWKPHGWAGGRNYRELKPRRKTTCGRPFSGPVQINADGKMMVCCFDYNAELTVGDTYKNTIKEILKDKPFIRIREKHESGHLEGLICQKCDQLNEDDEPLLYSNRDPEKRVGCTSSTKFCLS